MDLGHAVACLPGLGGCRRGDRQEHVGDGVAQASPENRPRRAVLRGAGGIYERSLDPGLLETEAWISFRCSGA